MDITELTVHELLNKIENKEITSSEIIEAYVNQIDDKENLVDAFLSIKEDEAIEKAKRIDESERKTKLSGIPIGIKDNICVKNMKATCASKILENFVSPYNATVIEKINDENMIILGKTNLDEFAMGTSTEHSAFKSTKNPWDINKVPGGSSGGSAAAVAANMVPWALGSDTGGSVRQPASLCGVVGLKPTYGLVSRYGLIAYASSLDQIGTLTKDVEDSALLMNVICGHDEKDTTSANISKVDYTANLNKDIKGLKIGIPKEYFGEGINENVKTAIKNAIKEYEKMGATIEEFSFPVAEYALATYYIIACAEASSNLGRFDGIRYGYRTPKYDDLKDIFVKSRTEGFGDEVKRRIILGTYVLSSGYYDAYYKKAQKVRTFVKDAFENAFKKYDVLLTPTSPVTAFNIGEKSENPLELYLLDLCTVPINVAGVPAISIPCGLDKDGMPIGMQIIGNKFEEEKIMNVAYKFEQEFKFRERYKPTFKK